MKRIIFITTIIITMATLEACQKTKDAGSTSAVNIANEWWVTLDSVGIPDVYGIGHIKITTYNTSANDNSIFVDDNKNGYGFKIKATTDYTNLTFSSIPLAANEYYIQGSTSFPETVNLAEGKIFLKAGHSKSGNIADSIHMKLEFSDNPGFIYEMNGVARTRFAEDDY